MNSGKLALLSSDTAGIDSDVYEFNLPENSTFDTVTTTVRIDEEISLSTGATAYVGRVAQEEIERVERTNITEEGRIQEDKTSEKVTKSTSFLMVPDAFVTVKNSAGEFFFPLLNEETSHSAYPAEISIDEFTNDYPEAEYWKVGFQNRGDGAENGVLYGNTVFEDSEFGKVVANSNKNQLGIEFEHNGELQKLLLTRSGYINLYNSEESGEFADLILDKVLQYAQMK